MLVSRPPLKATQIFPLPIFYGVVQLTGRIENWNGEWKEGENIKVGAFESPQGKSFGGMRTTEWRRFSELAINRHVSSLAQISVDPPPKPPQSPCTCSWTDICSGWPVVDLYIWREYPRICLYVFGCTRQNRGVRNENRHNAFAERSGLQPTCNYLLMAAPM